MDCQNIQTSGSFTITVTRVGSTGNKVPFQLFGALDGVATVKQDKGVLSTYVPGIYATGGETKVARWTVDGDLEIIDTATNEGVLVEAAKIPYHSLIDFIAAQNTPNGLALISSNTKFAYSQENSRSEVWKVRNRSYYEDLNENSTTPEDYFSANQEQSNIVNVSKMLEISPATKLDALMSENETKLTFTFSLSVAG